MKSIANFLNQPYPYYIPFSRSFRLLIILSLIIPLFLLIFEPFGLGSWDCPQKLVLTAGLFLPIFISLVINFYGISRLFPSFFNEEKWSIWREVVWSLWNVLIIILATSWYGTIVPVCQTTSIQWSTQIINSVLVGLFPGAICIYYNYSSALRRKLRRADEINENLLSKVAFYEQGQVQLTSASEKESLCLSTESLLYIQAYDNYCKIFIKNGATPSFRIIRSSLKNLEQQIDFPFIVRCHRSYIVNLASVVKVHGNAREYRLILDGITEPIPVSRETYRKVLGLLKEFPPQTSINDDHEAYSTIMPRQKVPNPRG